MGRLDAHLTGARRQGEMPGRIPLVTEDIQDGCLQRLTARARFNEGLPQELATKVVEQFHNEHAERYLRPSSTAGSTSMT